MPKGNGVSFLGAQHAHSFHFGCSENVYCFLLSFFLIFVRAHVCLCLYLYMFLCLCLCLYF